MSKDLANEIMERFEDTGVSFSGKFRMYVNTPNNQLHELLRFLKERGFNYLALMSCVDWIDDNEFELVYQLGNMSETLRIIVKTRIPRENASYDTVMNIFKNAQVYEREIHELFGIQFDGNPGLNPLFLEEWQKFHPFKKDFDSRKYVKETFESIPPIPGMEADQ